MELSREQVLRYYTRKDIQQQIVSFAKNREVGIHYHPQGFGPRPDILQYENDVFELAKKGATSFHVSEEYWRDPLLLKSGMVRQDLDQLRTGFDCILDIDTPFFEYAKITTSLLIEALEFYNISSIGLKFSGSKGFHILIPFSSFPQKVNNVETRLLFPEAPRMIAAYLKTLIHDGLSQRILEMTTLPELAEGMGKKTDDLKKKGIFDPYTIVELDTIFLSSRHMMRAPYSLNEKKWLASIPIEPREVKTFSPSLAKPENIEVTKSFLPISERDEATELIIQAFDTIVPLMKKDDPLMEKKLEKRTYELPKTKIPAEFYPPCIQQIMKGLPTDGRKRAIFVLINFYKHMGYTLDEIQTLLLEWNKKNYQPLKEGYILSQVSWHKRQRQNILPPNCNHEAYYAALGVKCPNEICEKAKNPVNYVMKRLSMLKHKNTRKVKTKRT